MGVAISNRSGAPRGNRNAAKHRLAQDLAADPGVTAATGHGGDRTTKQVDNVHLNKLNSNSAERIVRRLKCDAPAIAEQSAAAGVSLDAALAAVAWAIEEEDEGSSYAPECVARKA